MWFACGVCPCVVAAACVKTALILRALDNAGIVHLLQHTTPARAGTHSRACNMPCSHLLLCNSLQQRVPHRLRARLRVVHHIRCPHSPPPSPCLAMAWYFHASVSASSYLWQSQAVGCVEGGGGGGGRHQIWVPCVEPHLPPHCSTWVRL